MNEAIIPRSSDQDEVETSRTPPFIPSVDIEILFRSSDLLIVNKPYDLRVDGKQFKQTLEQFVLENIQRRREIQGDSYFNISMDKYRLVHQLDFATSGAITLGLTKKGASMAGEIFRDRSAEKFYLAVVENHFSENEIGKSQIIDLPIAEIPDDFRMTVGLDGNGKSASTVYTPVFNGVIGDRKVALVVLKLNTGRRHQIRVHLQYIGHNILGDATYGEKPRPHLNRMYLHAWRLKLMFKCRSGSQKLMHENIQVEAGMIGENDFLSDLGLKEEERRRLETLLDVACQNMLNS
jgi:tRNA pseudouridine32 synthase / 23S rRNA pseudouridine746 synthase